MAPTVSQSVLVYDRIAQNRVKTVLLVLVAVGSIVPFVALLSYGAADFVDANFVSHTHRSASREPAPHRSLMPQPGEMTYEVDREWQGQSDDLNRTRRQEQVENEQLKLRIMAGVALSLSAVLGLLFWGLASSTASQVLALSGARLPARDEAEAKRLLENLAIGAGLRPPRLYVIDSPTPNAFAAGMNPARSVVAVTTGLIALLDHRELEGVLAHEISHIGNRDTRLNTVVASIALFLRLPHLLRRRTKERGKKAGYQWGAQRPRFRLRYTLALIPVYVYVFFIAPFLAAVIRASISRSREFLADADAALLTRFPEGLLRALAKIRGAGSIVAGSNPVISHLYFADPSPAATGLKLFTGNLLATHPPIQQRIERLSEFNGGHVPASVIETAMRTGQDFGRDHPPLASIGLTDTVSQDELSVLTLGSPMGRVYRALSATPLYDQNNSRSAVLAKVPAGALLVVFDDPGKFRQVLTANQTFGYIPATVKLKRLDMLPAEVFETATQPAQSAQAPAPDAGAANVYVQAHELGTGYTAPPAPAPRAVVGPKPKAGLTGAQIAFVAGFFVISVASILLIMFTLNK